METKQLENVSFDFIRYANCWEDAEALLKGLELTSTSHVISIASAGDNCFSMLTKSPELVVAVDISEVQLFLVELKKIAIAQLNHPQFLEFLGFNPSLNRLEIFESIQHQLRENCRLYWANNLALIEKGIIHQGKFEKYFQLFKRDVLHTIHSSEIVNELMRVKSAEAQLEFHTNQWNTEAWREMYKDFFGVKMMGDHGRDPAFLKYVKGNVPDLILAREVAHLSSTNCQKNHFLYYILHNQFEGDFLPHYARKENFDLIKSNLNRLVLHHGLLESALAVYPRCTHFNLSDIFEYMSDDLFEEVAKNILSNSADKARLVYWNLMIPRKIETIFPQQIQYLKNISESLKNEDLGYFYDALIVEEKQ
jgi:S-adenosylmethionine-diacylglycerol 3-amino-3-carboxypropyl transferase